MQLEFVGYNSTALERQFRFHFLLKLGDLVAFMRKLKEIVRLDCTHSAC